MTCRTAAWREPEDVRSFFRPDPSGLHCRAAAPPTASSDAGSRPPATADASHPRLPKPPSLAFHLKNVVPLIPCRRHRSCVFAPASCHLADAQSFAAFLAPLRKAEWVVYAKRPFGGPEAVLAYLSRYTHRVAIANSRLI